MSIWETEYLEILNMIDKMPFFLRAGCYENVNLKGVWTFQYFTQIISTWGVRNNIDFLSLPCTRNAEDVRHVRFIHVFFVSRFITFSDLFSFSPIILTLMLIFLTSKCVYSVLLWSERISYYRSFTQHYEIALFSILQAREYLSKLGDLKQTQIFAKIENIEVRNCKILAIEYASLL